VGVNHDVTVDIIRGMMYKQGFHYLKIRRQLICSGVDIERLPNVPPYHKEDCPLPAVRGRSNAIAHLPRVERVPYFVATAAEYVGY